MEYIRKQFETLKERILEPRKFMQVVAGPRNKDEYDKEVDFIIDNGGEVTAIEVKSGRRGMNAGLPDFVEAFKPKRSFVVGTGGVSLEDFLGCEIETILDIN